MRCDAKATASYFWHLDSAGAIRVLRQKQSCVWIRKCSPLIAYRETQNTLCCRKTPQVVWKHHLCNEIIAPSKVFWLFLWTWQLNKKTFTFVWVFPRYTNFLLKSGYIQQRSWNVFDEACCSRLHGALQTDAPSQPQMAPDIRGHNVACGTRETTWVWAHRTCSTFYYNEKFHFQLSGSQTSQSASDFWCFCISLQHILDDWPILLRLPSRMKISKVSQSSSSVSCRGSSLQILLHSPSMNVQEEEAHIFFRVCTFFSCMCVFSAPLVSETCMLDLTVTEVFLSGQLALCLLVSLWWSWTCPWMLVV